MEDRHGAFDATTDEENEEHMKKEILRGMRPPGWELLTDAAREAVICELAALPEDVGAHPVREQAPACARANEVVDALRRAAEYEGVTKADRVHIGRWQSLGHAASIAALLDLATIAGGHGLGAVMKSDSDLIGGPCIVCDQPIAPGEQHARARTLVGAREAHVECVQLQAIGHQYGVCGCTNYAGQPTTRAAALELARRIAERQRAGMS
jgi:hypothetical protein